MNGRALSPRPPLLPETQGAVTLVNPSTGEVIPRDAPTGDLAQVLDAIREWESLARYAKRLIGEELHQRMDRDLTLTLHVDGFDVKGQGKNETVYDGEGLLKALAQLAADGRISVEAMHEAVGVVTTYKVKPAGVRKLRSAGFDEVVDAYSEKRPRDARRITLSRKGGAL